MLGEQRRVTRPFGVGVRHNQRIPGFYYNIQSSVTEQSYRDSRSIP